MGRLGAALRDLAVVWTLLSAQPCLAARAGHPAAAGASFAAATLWLLATRARPLPGRSAGPRLLSVGAGLASGFVSLPAWCVVSGWLAQGLGVPSGPEVPPGSASAAMLPALLVTGPLFEELLYRERLLGALSGCLPRPLALAASSVAFAWPHPEPRVRVATFGVGMMLGAIWLRSRSVALCVGLHSGLNLATQVSGVPPARLALPVPASALLSAAILVFALRGRRT